MRVGQEPGQLRLRLTLGPPEADVARLALAAEVAPEVEKLEFPSATASWPDVTLARWTKLSESCCIRSGKRLNRT